MSERFLRIDRAGLAAEDGAPDPGRVTDGAPRHRTWNAEDDGQGLYAGIWEATPGEWQVDYAEWEFCHILQGVSVITEAGGEPVTLVAGDSFVLRPGFKGRWRVVETTVKHYVVRL